MGIPKRRLGRTGMEVTILGLDGEGVLRTHGFEREAYALINRALAGALARLHGTLRTMKTDHLDLWQVHDVRTGDDIEELSGPSGAIEAFVEAKKKGLVRFLGITGHLEPAIIRTCIEQYQFDTVLLPVNPAEPAHRSFISEVIPLARVREMGVVGMKVYLCGFAAQLPGHIGMEPYFRFTLSQPVSTVVIGCDNLRQLEENVHFARTFEPMSDEEQMELVRHVTPYARELMYYKP